MTIRKVVIASLAAAIVAMLAGPAALAQQSGDYGQDVYPGAEGGAGGQQPTDSTASAKKTATGWTMLQAKLTPEAEVPTATGEASGTANVKVKGTQVCFDVNWSGVQATASHIHKAPTGKAGAVVVPFFASEQALGVQSKASCTNVSASLAKAIAGNPANYYVNVHSDQFPKGAIRGQLAEAGGAGQLPYTGSSRSRGLLLLGMIVVAAGSTLLAVGKRRRRPAHARR